MLIEDIDLCIWVSFFTAELAFIILGYIGKLIQKPVEKMYNLYYPYYQRYKKRKREKS